MGDMNKALDEYAQLLPDYLDRNPSVTAELLAGLYSSGHYAELVNLSDYLRATGLAQRLDAGRGGRQGPALRRCSA